MRREQRAQATSVAELKFSDAAVDYPARHTYVGQEAGSYDVRCRDSLLRRFMVRRENRVLQSVAASFLQPPATVLDAPTGTGRFLPLLREMGFHVTGMDISMDMLREQASRSRGETPRSVRADCEALPFPDGAFDCVLSVRYMGHLPPVVRVRVLREFNRVARQGLIVAYPVLNPLMSLKFALGNLLHWLRHGASRPWWPATPASLAQELARAGLVVCGGRRLLGPLSQIVFLALKRRPLE